MCQTRPSLTTDGDKVGRKVILAGFFLDFIQFIFASAHSASSEQLRKSVDQHVVICSVHSGQPGWSPSGLSTCVPDRLEIGSSGDIRAKPKSLRPEEECVAQ